MGLFDAIKNVGAAVSSAVENAANEYKEKKAYEAAESEMKMSINDDINEYAENHIMSLDFETAELVMSLYIRTYDSFAKEGYADSVDLLGAIAYGADISDWSTEYKNSEVLVKAYELFYKDYYTEASTSDWYVNVMAPFYGEDAKMHLCSVLNLMMAFYIGDLADEVCVKKYGEDNTVWNTISQNHFDFWNPLVAFFMNSADDMDFDTNLNKYEKKCFERYRDVTLFLIGRNAGLCNKNDELEHVFLKENGEPLFVGVVNNALVYYSAIYPDITKIEHIKKLQSIKFETIKFEDILYWKQKGDKRTEVGLKQPNAVVALYAASKGVVAPRRLEEREIDTREIEFVTKTSKMHFSIKSLDVFERLIPQFEYDRVMIGK